MYDGAYAARDAGVNLAFVTSNESTGRCGSSRTPKGHRPVMVGYKGSSPTRSPTAPTAIRWRTWIGRSRSWRACSSPWTATSIGAVCRRAHRHEQRPFEGTGLEDGVPIKAEPPATRIHSSTDPAPDALWRNLLASFPLTNFLGSDDYTTTRRSTPRTPVRVFATGTMDCRGGTAPEAQRLPTTRPPLHQTPDLEHPEQDAQHLGRVRGRRPDVGHPPRPVLPFDGRRPTSPSRSRYHPALRHPRTHAPLRDGRGRLRGVQVEVRSHSNGSAADHWRTVGSTRTAGSLRKPGRRCRIKTKAG